MQSFAASSNSGWMLGVKWQFRTLRTASRTEIKTWPGLWPQTRSGQSGPPRANKRLIYWFCVLCVLAFSPPFTNYSNLIDSKEKQNKTQLKYIHYSTYRKIKRMTTWWPSQIPLKLNYGPFGGGNAPSTAGASRYVFWLSSFKQKDAQFWKKRDWDYFFYFCLLEWSHLQITF